MAEPGHEAEEIQEVIWKYAGWAVVLLVCVGAGVFLGWTLWGDAASLRRELNEATEQVNSLKNEREAQNSRLALERRYKEECEQKLADLQQQ